MLWLDGDGDWRSRGCQRASVLEHLQKRRACLKQTCTCMPQHTAACATTHDRHADARTLARRQAPTQERDFGRKQESHRKHFPHCSSGQLRGELFPLYAAPPAPGPDAHACGKPLVFPKCSFLLPRNPLHEAILLRLYGWVRGLFHLLLLCFWWGGGPSANISKQGLSWKCPSGPPGLSPGCGEARSHLTQWIRSLDIPSESPGQEHPGLSTAALSFQRCYFNTT